MTTSGPCDMYFVLYISESIREGLDKRFEVRGEDLTARRFGGGKRLEELSLVALHKQSSSSALLPGPPRRFLTLKASPYDSAFEEWRV